MGRSIVTILLNSGILFLLARVIPGVRLKGYGTAVLVMVVYGVLSFLLKTLLMILTLPFLILTLGLFALVINGFLLWLTDKVIDDFEIESGTSLGLMTLGLTLGQMLVHQIVR